jgi:ATP-dependent RNA helicase DDX52/ROK1
LASQELALPCAVPTSEESDTERAEAIRRLRTGAVLFLITTDLGGRGIDLAALQTVINFDLPPGSTTCIHRIGRTARAGRAGNAITFFTTDDQQNLKPVASVMKKYGYEVEDWMLKNPDRRHRGARALFEPVKGTQFHRGYGRTQR